VTNLNRDVDRGAWVLNGNNMFFTPLVYASGYLVLVFLAVCMVCVAAVARCDASWRVRVALAHDISCLASCNYRTPIIDDARRVAAVMFCLVESDHYKCSEPCIIPSLPAAR